MLLRYESLGAKNVSKFFLHASHTSTPLPIMSSYSPAEELLPKDKMNKATKALKDFIRAFSIVGGAERGAPVSQGAYRRVCGAATPKGAAQRGCSATGPPQSLASCLCLWQERIREQVLQRQLLLDDSSAMKPVVHRLPPRRLLPQFPRKERERRPECPGRQRGVSHRI